MRLLSIFEVHRLFSKVIFYIQRLRYYENCPKDCATIIQFIDDARVNFELCFIRKIEDLEKQKLQIFGKAWRKHSIAYKISQQNFSVYTAILYRG